MYVVEYIKCFRGVECIWFTVAGLVHFWWTLDVARAGCC